MNEFQNTELASTDLDVPSFLKREDAPTSGETEGSRNSEAEATETVSD